VESKVHSALRPPMAYCASPGWLWWWRNWWNDWQGKPKYSEKTCLSAALSTTNPTCCPNANPGRRGGKPTTNRLSYGTASILSYFAQCLPVLYPIDCIHIYSVGYNSRNFWIFGLRPLSGIRTQSVGALSRSTENGNTSTLRNIVFFRIPDYRWSPKTSNLEYILVVLW
jgi:hypothetical protein